MCGLLLLAGLALWRQKRIGFYSNVAPEADAPMRSPLHPKFVLLDSLVVVGEVLLLSVVVVTTLLLLSLLLLPVVLLVSLVVVAVL